MTRATVYLAKKSTRQTVGDIFPLKQIDFHTFTRNGEVEGAAWLTVQLRGSWRFRGKKTREENRFVQITGKRVNVLVNIDSFSK